MIKKLMTLGAATTLALSAHAQLLYNWTLDASAVNFGVAAGTGSGQLTLTNGEVTALSGTLSDGTDSWTVSLAITPPIAFDNALPFLPPNPIAPITQGLLMIRGTLSQGDFIYLSPGASQTEPIWTTVDFGWSTFGGGGQAIFTYTPVPEPSTWAMAGVFGLGSVVTVMAHRRRQAARKD